MNYDAYGNQWQGDTPDPFGYCGEYYDTESGLIYLRNRYYESETGRFITEDPAKDGLNWYSYCAGNPVVRKDLNGLNWVYDIWNFAEDSIWKGAAACASLVGLQLSADLIRLAASGSGNSYYASNGSYASNLAKNDAGISKTVNDTIWMYGTSTGAKQVNTPKISYEIPVGNGDLGAALHYVDIQINATQQNDGTWYATVKITDTFDFTAFENPFTQDSALAGVLWAINDVAYYDTKWGLLDSVNVTITYDVTI